MGPFFQDHISVEDVSINSSESGYERINAATPEAFRYIKAGRKRGRVVINIASA
jgi:hypothetical protein